MDETSTNCEQCPVKRLTDARIADLLQQLNQSEQRSARQTLSIMDLQAQLRRLRSAAPEAPEKAASRFAVSGGTRSKP